MQSIACSICAMWVNSLSKNTVTVQGNGDPVPAEFGSEQAGSLPSRSSDCNATLVNLAEAADTATSQTTLSGFVLTPLTAFANSRKTMRSPTRKEQITTQKRGRSSPPVLLENDTKAQPTKRVCERDELQISKKVLHKLGEKIKELNLIMQDKNRRTVNQTMRDMASSITALLETLTDTRSTVITPHTETLPVKIMAKPAERECTSQTIATPEPNQRVEGEKQHTIRKVSTVNERKSPSAQLKGTNRKDRQQEDWTKVESRKKKRPPRKRRIQKQARPDALLVKKGDLTFAEVLKKIKTDTSLTELGDNVARIRKTAGGDLLLELSSKGDQGKMKEFQEQLKTAIGRDPEVRTLYQETVVIIKDLDEITTQNEILEALETAFEIAKGDCRVKSLKTAYRGTQAATIGLPPNAARKLVKEGKVKIGWVVCRIREQNEPIKCYRCFNLGHRAINCKSECDRSNCCLKCGEEGHKAKICKKQPKCLLCSEKPGSNNNHGTGTFRCPVYKEAVNKLRK